MPPNTPPDEPASPRLALLAAIEALEAQRDALGAAFVEAALAPLRQRLDAIAASEPVLRQVSIVFLDIVGSTRLGQRLDPEDIQAVVDGALARFTGLVATHGGKTLQYAGDNLLAAFGADGAREDDAERAVCCALALRDAGGEIGRLVRQRHGVDGFNVRVGVHTGSVLLGGGVDGGGTIRGNAVNVAARMEQSAPPGNVRISLDTLSQVQGLFEIERQPPLLVKGVDQPVGSALVHARQAQVRDDLRRGLAGVDTPLIGREAECAALWAGWGAVARGAGAAGVVLVGEAGVGKSRLLREFEAGLPGAAPGRCWRGRAQPYGEHQPFGLLRDLLQAGLGLGPAGHARLREDFDAALAAVWADQPPEQAQARAHLLGHLVGIDHGDSVHVRGIRHDAAQVRQRGLHAMNLLLQAQAREAPVLLVLEDLHWADAPTLDWLQGLRAALGPSRVFVVGTTRPELHERRPAMLAGTGLQPITLPPLGEGASRTLADELLRDLPAAPEALLQVLLQGAEGNPFYMEELLRMLIDRGVVVADERPWRVDLERLSTLPVPPTLTGVIQARLDALPGDERQALQQASVVGAVFWDRALAAIDEASARLLPRPLQRSLVRPRPSSRVVPGNEYAFAHHLLHQVTYETVLKRVRRVWHAQVAAWLTSVSAQASSSGEWAGLVALHHERAGELALATVCHGEAAVYAADRFAHDAVLHHADRVLAALGQAELAPGVAAGLHWTALRLRERTLDLLGRRVEQAEALDAMDALAEARDDDALRGFTARRRADRAMRRGDWAGSGEAAERAIACAQRAGDDATRLMAVYHLATSLAARGQHDECERLAEAAAEQARALGLLREQAFLFGALGFSASRRGQAHQAMQYEQRVAPMLRALGDRRNEAISLSNQAVYWGNVGRFERATEVYGEALALARANGDRVIQLSTQLALVQMEFEQGRFEAVRQPYRALLAEAERIDARDMVVEIHTRLARAHLACQDWDAAQRSLEQAFAEADEVDPSLRGNLLALQAALAAGLGRFDEARSRLGALLDAGTDTHWEQVAEPLEAAWLLADVLRTLGDPRAGTVARQAGELLRQRASALPEDDREGYLQAVHLHHALLAWA